MILELFSCSGGMAEGMRRASLPVNVAYDFDADACDSYEANMGHRPRQEDVRKLLDRVQRGYQPTGGQIDLIVADPPCTPWSRAGKRQGLADDRDMLRTTVEIIRLLLPRCWLIANVPGLDDADHWDSVVQPVIGGMAHSMHYHVDYIKLDAANFGVPQHRVRPFWFGHHRDLPCLNWPSPTHCDPRTAAHPHLPGIDPLKPWVTCREALGHLPIEQLGRLVRLRWREDLLSGPRKNHRPTDADRPAATITRNANGDGCLLANARRWDRPQSARTYGADEPGPVVTSKVARVGAGVALDWPWDRPSTTQQKDDRLSCPGHHDPRVSNSQHGPNAIVLSESAAAILQGFPPRWKFCGKTKRARWSQIGQAMPPPLAEAVGRSIKAWIDRCLHVELDDRRGAAARRKHDLPKMWIREPGA